MCEEIVNQRVGRHQLLMDRVIPGQQAVGRCRGQGSTLFTHGHIFRLGF